MLFRTMLIAAVLALGSLVPASASAAAQAACNRACLAGLITQYVDALAARDPSRLPTTPGVRFSENSKDFRLGEGVWWRTPLTNGGFRQDYLDTRAQVAAAHVLMLDNKVPVLYTVILHVRDRKIAGIETLVQRVAPDFRFQPTELGGPIRGMNDPIPAGKRQSRAEMIKVALTYTEGLRIGDFTKGKTPFAAGTYRVENGSITAGPGCGRADCGMYAQKIIVHPDVKASVAAVDEQNGTVLLWMNFGDTNSYGPGNALVTFEAFKVWGGEIHSILAFFPILPKDTTRNWPSTD